MRLARVSAALTLGLLSNIASAIDASVSLTNADLTAFARGVRAQGTSGIDAWFLVDNLSRMLMSASQTDAQNALAVAKRHTAQCFIGRGNARPNRADYIVGYWKGDSGIATTVSPEDCLPYNPAQVSILNPPASAPPTTADWVITDGTQRMLILSSAQDAQDALTVVRRHTAQCFIGRGNQRAERQMFIADYWVGDTPFEGTVSREDCYRYDPSSLRTIEERQWTWKVIDPEFRVRTAGITFAGKLRVQYATAVTIIPFERLATVSFVASTSRLRLSVEATPVVVAVSGAGGPQTLGSINVGSYYSTSLGLRGVFQPTSGTITATPTNVSVQLLDGSMLVSGDA